MPNSLFFNLSFLLCIFANSKSNENNKPFGSGFSEDIETFDGFLKPVVFIKNFIIKSKPVLMKQAANNFPAIKKWNDDYFLNLNLEKYKKHTIAIEREKKEDRHLNSVEINFKDFVRLYNKSNIYMVDTLPEFLNSDIIIPWSLQCKFIEENIYQVLMWFSSGGTSSVVHTDDMENINCLLSGQKTFVLVDPIKHKDKIPLNKNGAYSDIDVDKVDFDKYNQISSVDYIIAKMIPGDCLYIPKLWIHQVRSFERNIAINIWFRMPIDKSPMLADSVLERDCNEHPDDYKTFYGTNVLGLDNIVYYKNDVLDKLSEFFNKSVYELNDVILKLYNDVDEKIMEQSGVYIQSILKDIIEEVDLNKNSIIEVEEINSATPENLERVGNYMNYLKTYLTSLSIFQDEEASLVL